VTTQPVREKAKIKLLRQFKNTLYNPTNFKGSSMEKKSLFYLPSTAKIWRNTFCALSTCAALSGTALAEDKASDWSGSLNIGVEHYTGNTNSSDVNASLTIGYNENFQANRRFRHIISATVDNEKTKMVDGSEIKTREKEGATYKLGYFLNQDSHIEGTLAYLHDLSINIDKAKVVGLQYVRNNILNQSEHQLKLGAGIANFDVTHIDDLPAFEVVAGQVSYHYTGQLIQNFSLDHKGVLQAASDIRYVTLDTSISYAMTQNLSLSLVHSFNTLINNTTTRDAEKNSSTNLNIGFTF
jgi:putative salt-induced outer membrane protein YdiY